MADVTDPRGERGDIVMGWLGQLLLVVAVIAVLGHEVVALGVTRVALDDTAREVARAARDEYRGTSSLDRATRTAEQVAADRGAAVVTVAVEGDELLVELERTASTLLLHRAEAFDGLTTATATTRIRWEP